MKYEDKIEENCNFEQSSQGLKTPVQYVFPKQMDLVLYRFNVVKIKLIL